MVEVHNAIYFGRLAQGAPEYLTILFFAKHEHIDARSDALSNARFRNRIGHIANRLGALYLHFVIELIWKRSRTRPLFLRVWKHAHVIELCFFEEIAHHLELRLRLTRKTRDQGSSQYDIWDPLTQVAHQFEKLII